MAQQPVTAGTAGPAPLVMEGIGKAGHAEGTQALAWLELQVERGEFLTLLGPSGAGKSVAIELVAGFLQPEAGRILIKGERQARLPPWRRDIGLVLEQPDLFPEMDVLSNAAFPLEARGMGRAEREERAAAMLERWGIPPALARLRPAALSPARQMRVAMARATVHAPALLLLDDPFRALDGAERESLAADLARLRQALGWTVLHAARDPVLASVLSDRMVVLQGGRAHQTGTPQALYENPADPVVAALTGPCNRLPGRVLSVEDGVCLVRLDCGLEATGLPVTGPEGSPVPGANCTLVIRPEHVAVAPLPPAAMGEDAVAARLIEARFAGGEVRLRLAIGEGGELVAHRPTGLPLPQPGEEASIAWNLSAARVHRDPA
ncbi:ABC transporter ATP-binding protein [Pararoseomonas indoligenes]|uniref:ABC transporter ATP-binding protein n=1 Tax=Roseomonas indoligenes TaxID=2820811 RepID=A0A940S2P9_9PROT|nr:ABC transporter ATP-binding protein [Pararoseomonas indoligenes]MBP0491366.1 ABC transporter ATP-binding protein [Pararoseomonas indoligenes]